MSAYETVIGLEVHVQLNTKSKAFCSDAVNFGAKPNSHISAISLAHPGTLPRLNTEQLKSGVLLGLALDSKISMRNTFDRKNYFYPDLPKGYQITQDRLPICIGGHLPIYVNGKWKKVKIHHLHMEEDAGKSIHDKNPNFTLVDLNRAGTPLLEIVTDPDLRSADEVDAFMSGMRQLVRYLGISDGNMQEGSLRCDVNISIRPVGSETFGNRCEVKNMNSMKFARKAIEFEVKRQIAVVESGGTVKQQTLNFDAATGTTSPLRSKENANDYRYFPEPDLLPIRLTEKDIETAQSKLPKLPWEVLNVLEKDYGLSTKNAVLLSEEKDFGVFALDFIKNASDFKAATNFLILKVRPYLADNNLNINELEMSKKQLHDFLTLISEDKISSSVAYEKLFPLLAKNPETAVKTLAEKAGLIQESGGDFIEKLVDEIIEKNPKETAAFRKGKKALIGFFMGELMKASRGKANPKTGKDVLMKKLNG